METSRSLESSVARPLRDHPSAVAARARARRTRTFGGDPRLGAVGAVIALLAAGLLSTSVEAARGPALFVLLLGLGLASAGHRLERRG